MQYTIFGYLYVGKDHEYDILFDEDANILLRHQATQVIESVDDKIDSLGYYLTNPWDQIRYYEDENGNHHWYSIVYDWIEIDIWGKTIEEMMNTVAFFMKETIDYFMDKEEKNQLNHTIAPTGEESLDSIG